MFKVFHVIIPTYTSQNFNLRSNLNTSVNLRYIAAGCFVPPKPRTECFKQSMKYFGCLIWNSLPDEVRNAQTVESFKKKMFEMAFELKLRPIENDLSKCYCAFCILFVHIFPVGHSDFLVFFIFNFQSYFHILADLWKCDAYICIYIFIFCLFIMLIMFIKNLDMQVAKIFSNIQQQVD